MRVVAIIVTSDVDHCNYRIYLVHWGKLRGEGGTPTIIIIPGQPISGYAGR